MWCCFLRCDDDDDDEAPSVPLILLSSDRSRACSVRWAWSQLRGTRRRRVLPSTPGDSGDYSAILALLFAVVVVVVLNVEDRRHLPEVSPAACGQQRQRGRQETF